jgi:hypothetical protein
VKLRKNPPWADHDIFTAESAENAEEYRVKDKKQNRQHL